MAATIYSWSEIEPDRPVPYLTRRKIVGEKMFVARISLERGFVVASHRHESEQVSYIVSGRLRWTLGEEGSAEHRNVETSAGEVLVIPGNTYHGVCEVIEDAEVIDVLSPVGPMGIDSPGR